MLHHWGGNDISIKTGGIITLVVGFFYYPEMLSPIKVQGEGENPLNLSQTVEVLTTKLDLLSKKIDNTNRTVIILGNIFPACAASVLVISDYI
jgi:hypothetical protein